MKYRRLESIRRRIKRNHSKIEQVRSNRLHLPFYKFVMLMPYMTDETIESLSLVPTPAIFCKKIVPQDLQLATFGTLTELQNAPVKNNYFATCCKLVAVLTGESEETIAKQSAIDVLGLVNMIQSEMERIGKLFQSLNTDKSSDEIMAGIEKLNFGAFGLVDWYAQRMGIIDHEEVFATPWARIWQCMRIDHEQGEFEKRYREIVTKRSIKK